ncbi:MAG: hypothetical protein CM1200mP30_32450 [Pseudomonadota bacterium]|nr:MAG: hypothetical protein CM1200mP30_32450 [Pseudomonadota bacterium]
MQGKTPRSAKIETGPLKEYPISKGELGSKSRSGNASGGGQPGLGCKMKVGKQILMLLFM